MKARKAASQTNVSDCGVYLLLFSERVCEAFFRGDPPGSEGLVEIGPEAPGRKRAEIRAAVRTWKGEAGK